MLLLLLFGAAMSHASGSTRGLAAWWKCEETGGTTAVDSAPIPGGAQNATMYTSLSGTGFVGSVAGIRYEWAFDLAGGGVGCATCEYLRMPATVGSNTFTLALWLHVDTFTSSDMRIFNNGEPSTNAPNILGLRIVDQAGANIGGSGYAFTGRRFSVGQANVDWTTFDTGIDVKAGVWYHVALVSVGTSYTLYVDGVSQGTITDANAQGGNATLSALGAFSVGSTLRIWDINFGSYLDGKIDDVRVYGTALSVPEVQDLADRTVTTTYLSDLTPTVGPPCGLNSGGGACGNPPNLYYYHNDYDETGPPPGAGTLDKAGDAYAKGLITHPNPGAAVGSLIYNVNGATSFKARLGKDGSGGNGGNGVIFRIYLDGSATPVYNSGVVNWADPIIDVNLNVAGRSTITLEVDPNGEYSFDHAVWFGARLEKPAVQAGTYNHFRSITVPTSSLGASCAGSLTSFPVLVSIASDSQLKHTSSGGYVQNLNGYDIVFTDFQGNRLDFEIEQYVPTTGQLVAWVRVPTLSNVASTTFYMRYDKAGVTSSSANPPGVWDTGFKAVWHLKESSTGTAGEFKDSTANVNDGQGRGCIGLGAGPPTRTTGQIGYGQQLYCQWVEVPDTTTTLQITGTITLEGWAYSNAWAGGDFSDVVARQYGTGSGDSYQLGAGPSGTASSTPYSWMTSGNVNGGTVNTGAWYHLAATISGTNSSIYVNGVQTGTAGGLTITNTPGNPVTIGAQYNGGVDPWQGWNGILDEVRISNAARSQCWIETEYKNQSSPGTFYTLGAATAVELVSFEARGTSSGIELGWETGSEIRNLGFHVYRAASEGGPYQRITSQLIPGLGSSPVGASYSWSDSGLVGGTRYFYELEDLDSSGKTTRHGPVSAVAGVETTCTTCPPAPSPAPSPTPPPVPSPGGSGPGSPGPAPARVRFGDPERSSLRVVSHDSRGLTVELRTGGFYAVPQPDGTVRLEVPSFDSVDTAGEVDLPIKRAWLEIRPGRELLLRSVLPSDALSFDSLRLPRAGSVSLEPLPGGAVRALRTSRGEARQSSRLPLAQLRQTAFQGEIKKALLELTPFRWNARGGKLLLARRVLVTIAYGKPIPGEVSLGGSRGRAPLTRRPRPRGVLARLVLPAGPGLYSAPFEQLFPQGGPALRLASLRLSHQDAVVPFRVEPARSFFGPGSRLFFLLPSSSANPTGDTVFELRSASTGSTMPAAPPAPVATPLSSVTAKRSFESNRYYQSGLLQAEDLFLWDYVLSPNSKSWSFSLTGLAPEAATSASSLLVHLQGGSDIEGSSPDHHVRLSLNGVVLGDASWDGKTPLAVPLSVPPGVLVDGENSLALENLADTPAPSSWVWLDRFSVSFPARLDVSAGALEGTALAAGAAQVTGVSSPAFALDTTDPASPRWVGSFASSPLVFSAQAGRRYLVVPSTAVLTAQVRPVLASSLRSSSRQADYVILTPPELLPAAERLALHREGQGLRVEVVTTSEIYDEFGFGEAGPGPVRDFLSFAFHSWAPPAPRYVVLLGDASLDPKRLLSYAGTVTPAPDFVPSPMIQTSLMWTVSDPTLAAVNGEDPLPDLAIGRLPARNLDEAHSLVDKILAWEDGGQSLAGNAALVADNPDVAGDFEADALEVASLLQDRPTSTVFLSRLGRDATRTAIHDVLDSGVSLLSYVGHGAAGLWATENVFNLSDVKTLFPQPRQPLLMTWNCLNGYFPLPAADSLSEAFLRPPDKGAIAVFSPSAYSFDSQAHVFHRALVTQLVSGHNQRLGDAILAAQQDYAAQGALPEMLQIYQLLGDPALKTR